MKKFHIAIATNNIAETVLDYTIRLNCQPCLVIPNEYALWRTENLNFSIRHDLKCKPGELRHLGWEDDEINSFTSDKDVNEILWESFNAELQAGEIKLIWPEIEYEPDKI